MGLAECRLASSGVFAEGPLGHQQEGHNELSAQVKETLFQGKKWRRRECPPATCPPTPHSHREDIFHLRARLPGDAGTIASAGWTLSQAPRWWLTLHLSCRSDQCEAILSTIDGVLCKEQECYITNILAGLHPGC